MCGFAFSRSEYRFGITELGHVLNCARREGIEFVRFTGGEPLIHKEIVEMIALVANLGMRPSIITNGGLLSKRVDALQRAGLEQVVVSIDGATAATHDSIRRVPGLFSVSMRGLAIAIESGLRLRVNTVCGPSNFREMPALQDLLTEMKVPQWELSSLKLESRLNYSDRDHNDIHAMIQYVYKEAAATGRLVPMGKIWCGDTEVERERYFDTGTPPRPDLHCHIVRLARFLDARSKRLFPCNMLPHRSYAEENSVEVGAWDNFTQQLKSIGRHADSLYLIGPQKCTGCSASAAGLSNVIADSANQHLPDWAY